MIIEVKIHKHLFCFMAAILCLATMIYGQERTSLDSNRHVLTIFVVNSLKPIHWESPSSLVKSATKGFKAKLLHHRQFLLGHMIARLESPLVGGTKYSAMVSTSMKEKRILMLKEKIGLGILGVAMGGKLDSEADMKKDLKLFSRLGKLAYVKYHISEDAALKIVRFMEGFCRSEEGGLPPYTHYGGAFWPRYHNEGSGCTAYGMSMVDVAGLMGEEHNEWKVEINIPLELVGGDLNQGRKVPRKEILKHDSWASTVDSSFQEFIPFSIYDPSMVYDWVKKVRTQPETGYEVEEENNIPGLVADMTHIKPETNESVFSDRPESSLFIDHFLRKRRSGKTGPAPETPVYLTGKNILSD